MDQYDIIIITKDIIRPVTPQEWRMHCVRGIIFIRELLFTSVPYGGEGENNV
jgi:hypothetical protein